MPDLPSRKTASGRVLLIGEVSANADHVDAVRDQLKKIRDISLSDKEPGCQTYRIASVDDCPGRV